MFRRAIAGGIGFLVLACLTPSGTLGVVVRDDVARPDDVNYDPANDPYVLRGSPYSAVGFIAAGDSIGSGVLITNEWVLTAGHVVDSAIEGQSALVLFDNGGLSVVDAVYRHDSYRPFDDGDPANTGPAAGFDIGLMHLEDPVPTDPTHPDYIAPMQRYRGPANGMIGRVGTSVGYGLTGDGRIGFDDPNDPSDDPSEHLDGEKRAGDNVIDGTADRPAFHGPYTDPTLAPQFRDRPDLGLTKEQIAAQYLVSDFDSPGSPGVLPLEASVAPGDSGGPVFIDGDDPLSVSDDLIVGIHSFILGPPSPYGDGYDNASYTDLYGSINVALFNDWIDPLVGEVPEPGAASALALFAGTMVLRRRRTTQR